MRPRTPGNDRGSATIWVISCCALLMVVATVTAVRELAVLARHRAEAGADLAALAAANRIGRDAAAACPAAADVARQNGASLRSCQVRLAADGRSGTVVVRVLLSARLPLVGRRTVVASARAARLPAPGPPTPVPSTSGVPRAKGPCPTSADPVACWPASSVRAPPASKRADGKAESAWTSRSRGRKPAMSRSSP